MSTTRPSPANRRYQAYISHRREDNRLEGRRWGNWLQENLEGFRVSPKFAGQRNSREETAPHSLFPIYCPTEAHQGEELSEATLEALRSSETLVVIANPESAECKFVREEIRFFKEIGRADRIVVLMVAGEPHADIPTKAELGITEKDECLAEELRYGKPRKDGTVNWGAPVEPICADVRVSAEGDHRKITSGQGFTNKVAYNAELLRRGIPGAKAEKLANGYEDRLDRAIRTLAAGILGFPARDVINESHLAAVKRLKMGISVLGATTVVAAIFAILGYSSSETDGPLQNSANKASDITSETLTAATEQAVKLRANVTQLEESLAETTIRSEAQKAQIERQIVNTLASYRTGEALVLEVLEQLAQSSQVRLESIPAEDRKPEDQTLLASVLETRGRICDAQDLEDQSLRHFETSLAIVEENRDGFEDEVSWLADQSRLRHQIAKIRFNQSKWDGAEHAFKIASELDQRLAELDPEEAKWRQNLSAGQDYLAKIAELKNGGPVSLAATTTEDSDSADATTELPNPAPPALDKATLADSQEAAGDLEGAIASLKELLTEASSSQSDESSQRQLIATNLRLGRLLQRVQRSEEAMLYVRQGLALQEQFTFQWKDEIVIADLALAQIESAKSLLQKADPDQSTVAAQHAVETAQSLVKAAPQSIEAHSLLANAYEMTAKAQQAKGESALATGNLEAASDLRGQIAAAQPSDPASAKHYVEDQLALIGLHRQAGNLDAAATSLQKLSTTASRIYQQNPANHEWLKAAASANRSLSEIQSQLDDPVEAQKATIEAMSFTEKLAKLDPDNGDWLAQLQSDYQFLASAYQSQGNLPQAKAMLIRSAELARDSSTQDVASLLNLLTHEEQLANLSYSLGENLIAKEEFSIALTTAEQALAADPTRIETQAKIAEISKNIGNLAASLDQFEEAEAHYAKCLSIAAESANQAPESDVWWVLAGACHNQLGALHQKRGNLSNSKASYEAALQAFEYLAQRSPDPASYSGMALSYFGIAEVSAKLGNVDLAVRRFQDSFRFHQKLASAEPENVEWQSGIAESSFRIGQIYAENRNRREAIAWLNSAQEQIESMQKRSPLREEDRLVATSISEEIRSLGRFRVLGGGQ